MVFIDHGVAQVVVFIRKLEHRNAHGGAFLQAKALREAAGGLISHDNLERDDADPFHQGFAVAELFDIMGFDAVFLQELKHIIRHFVVDNAFTDNGSLFLAVKGGGVVFIIDNAQIRIIGCKHFFCLALVHLLSFLHNKYASFFI